MIVFSVDERTSFDNVPKWVREAERYCCDSAVIVIVGNKIDLRDEERMRSVILPRNFVPEDEASTSAYNFTDHYFETSAKKDVSNDFHSEYGVSINGLFERITYTLLMKTDY